MNTHNNTFHPESSCAQENNFDNHKRWDMEEEIEFLREQVDSLKQVLCHEYQLTNAYIQELTYTKQELEWMNEEISLLTSSKQEALDEVRGLDKTVSEKKPVGEGLTKVITVTNLSPAKLNNLDWLNWPILMSKLDECKKQSRTLKAQSDQIMAYSDHLKVQSDRVTRRSREIREQLRRINQQEKLFHKAS